MSRRNYNGRQPAGGGSGGAFTAPAAADVFVNPYTFVPFPAFPDPADRSAIRRAPAGHERLERGRFSGSVGVELTVCSPLLLRGIRPGEEGTFPRRPGRGADGQGVPFIPGSSLAGAVRSLHETLAGGCLRVFDADFRPGYRDVARDRPGWRLARVDAIDRDGRPTRLNVCDADVVWVPARDLAQTEALGSAEAVVTGATVHLESRGERVSFGKNNGRAVWRRQLTDPAKVRRGESWVVLVTDGSARPGERRNKTYGWVETRYFCAVGKLAARSSEVQTGTGWDQAWQRYLDAVDGTDDMRRARQEGREHDEKPEVVPVRFPVRRTKQLAREPEVVGRRIAARRRLFEGQVVWIRQGKAAGKATQPGLGLVAVEEISLSQVWRHAGGGHTAAERVPGVLHPCRDERELCPTCRIFGSADTGGSDRAAARQRSYRGHLRFSDGLPSGGDDVSGSVLCEPVAVALPPLSAPRPGAGQFYLETPKGKKVPQPMPQADPLREWGSALDAQSRRNLRGRKQYWLTGRPDRRPYFRATANRPEVFHELYARDDDSENRMLTHAEAVPARARFRYTVHYENLDRAELGGVLAALAPQYALRLPESEGDWEGIGGDDAIGFALGGGRPLGFGTCTSRITSLRVESAVGRYTGRQEDEAATTVRLQAAVDAFADSVPDPVRRTWSALRHALTLDRAAPHLVWYPPAGPLPEEGALPAQHLMPSFEFWKQSRGFRGEPNRREPEKETYHPLTSLPPATARPAQLGLETVPDAEQRAQGAERLRKADAQTRTSGRNGNDDHSGNGGRGRA
ncbi:CRISPR-associated RAMP family protein [Streptomyces fodineus]|uniref:CRISPR-associated RAMP family protein n=1 Tax=Streptomyces fodineus TaxID=1904616 RepID=A0A1D7Y6S3_9ACTN|nr:TIGR03986 family CRISPR-associated RAMP protein [Streptomyces fodineus]AOR31079.1 CRISPR-associated RAMP family protein [Streptomyces fodineus]